MERHYIQIDLTQMDTARKILEEHSINFTEPETDYFLFESSDDYGDALFLFDENEIDIYEY